MADDVEQAAVRPFGRVGPLPRRAGRAEANEERAPAGAVEVARDPVAALAPAVGEVVAADRLGALGERSGDGGRVHGAAPADAMHGFGMMGLLRCRNATPDTGQPRSPAGAGG